MSVSFFKIAFLSFKFAKKSSEGDGDVRSRRESLLHSRNDDKGPENHQLCKVSHFILKF